MNVSSTEPLPARGIGSAIGSSSGSGSAWVMGSIFSVRHSFGRHDGSQGFVHRLVGGKRRPDVGRQQRDIGAGLVALVVFAANARAEFIEVVVGSHRVLILVASGPLLFHGSSFLSDSPFGR